MRIKQLYDSMNADIGRNKQQTEVDIRSFFIDDERIQERITALTSYRVTDVD